MRLTRYSPLGLAAALLVSGCGSDAPDTAAAPSTKSLAGTVAVGAPITDGTLRIVDATGAVVATGIAVDPDGHYQIPELTGTGPFRIEACGYAGANYQCIYSVAQGPGTVNVTPITTAIVLLASGQAPAALMNGASTTLSPTAVDGAQTTLRDGLASVLAAGNVPATFDFVGGSLAAGSRTGYDKVLDAIGVRTGVDADKPFVQITPRIGTGNLYLEQNVKVGTLVSDAGAGGLSLGGLETLFRNMSAAMASGSACGNTTTGLVAQLATIARINGEDGESLQGPAQVAAGLCGMFEEEGLFGSKLLSPTLGRCDLSGNDPVCRVSFVLQAPDGSVESVGQGMGVTQENGTWKFVGNLDALGIHASVKAQRDARIDGDTPVYSYMRALAFDIPAASGLECARVSQRDADGHDVTLAYYKRYGSGTVRRLSLWTDNAYGNTRSTNPNVGFLRSADDTWVALPDGSAGDEVVRNFFRGGRAVTVSTFSDTACSVPFAAGGQGKTAIEVEVEGVPPTWASMPGLPWPELTATARSSLLALSRGAGAEADFTVSWTFPRGPLGLNGSTFCADRARCGQDDIGRIGEGRVAAAATSAVIHLENGATPLEPNGYKMVALYGRTADGVDLQSNAIVCAPGTVDCH
ncbi:MAG: hypothetical protein ABW067_14170 [Rhizobacter sp.]